MNSRAKSGGFTLIEAIVVIALTGIIAAIVAVFIRAPVESYFDTVRRAEMTDAADTAVRRMVRDLHRALPNSVRVSGTAIEFLNTSGGGRYRGELTALGAGDILDFTQNDTAFDVIGPLPAFAAGDQIVVYNLGANVDDADAYAGNTAINHNRRSFTAVAGTNVQFNPNVRFPLASPGNRFFVVDTPVSYVCNGGELRRHWGYPIVPLQNVPPAGGQNALLARNVTVCAFNYAPGVNERSGLVAIRLTITQGGENISLYQEVHVNNSP